MVYLMSETETQFRDRLGIEKVVNIADCSRYWEVEITNDVQLLPEDFSRLNIQKVHSVGCRNKCVYVPKL